MNFNEVESTWLFKDLAASAASPNVAAPPSPTPDVFSCTRRARSRSGLHGSLFLERKNLSSGLIEQEKLYEKGEWEEEWQDGGEREGRRRRIKEGKMQDGKEARMV